MNRLASTAGVQSQPHASLTRRGSRRGSGVRQAIRITPRPLPSGARLQSPPCPSPRWLPRRRPLAPHPPRHCNPRPAVARRECYPWPSGAQTSAPNRLAVQRPSPRPKQPQPLGRINRIASGARAPVRPAPLWRTARPTNGGVAEGGRRLERGQPRACAVTWRGAARPPGRALPGTSGRREDTRRPHHAHERRCRQQQPQRQPQPKQQR